MNAAAPSRRPLTAAETQARDRLKRCFAERRSSEGLTQEQAAHALGWAGQSAVSQFLTGNTAIHLVALLKFARLLRVAPEEIWPDYARYFGIDPLPAPPGAIAEVSAHYDVKRDALIAQWAAQPSGGDGSIADAQDEEIIRLVSLPRDWLHNVARINPAHAALFTVRGDSMEPTLCPGDTTVIDLSATAPSQGIHILRLDGHLLIKRLEIIPNAIRLLSDNRLYPPFDVRRDETAHLEILGKFKLKIDLRLLD